MTLGPNERKLIENLTKQRHKEQKKLHDWFSKQVNDISGGDKKIKKRFYLESKNEAPTDIRYYSLVNVQALKEFIKYGSNKVLDQIRVRSHAQTLAREEIEKLKKKGSGPDFKTMIITLAIVAIIGTIAYVTVSQYLNVNACATDLMAEKRSHGSTMGELANCETQLDYFKPGTIAKTINATGGAPPNGGVLQG